MPVSPLSFYIDIEPDRSPEWEVVARASLEFAAGVRELAYMIDPSFEFRLELDRGEEGSLWLKGLIRWVRGLGHAHPTMMTVAISAASWFTLETGSYALTKAYDALLDDGQPDTVLIAPEQLKEMRESADRAVQSTVAGEHFSRVYKELEKDPLVRGVGVGFQHDRPPAIIVPRSDFALRGRPPAPTSTVGERRTRTPTGDFVIIRPVLKEGGGRWRLRGPGGEFSADIADDAFYNAVLSGTAPVPLAAEIHISADLEVVEEMTPEKVWKPLSYRITKVHSIRRGGDQPMLFPPR